METFDIVEIRVVQSNTMKCLYAFLTRAKPPQKNMIIFSFKTKNKVINSSLHYRFSSNPYKSCEVYEVCYMSKNQIEKMYDVSINDIEPFTLNMNNMMYGESIYLFEVESKDFPF